MKRGSKETLPVSRKYAKVYEWDVFICHASEDKESFVRQLASQLKKSGLRVWYDDFTLTVGDNLLESINQGLSLSEYGIVVLSKAFFKKGWAQKELAGLYALEADGNTKILPVWLDIERTEIVKHYPMLADIVAAKASSGLESVVSRLMAAIQSGSQFTAQQELDFVRERQIETSTQAQSTEKLDQYEPPTVFFYDRIAEAFPGIRGLHEIIDKKEIISRLSILFREPLQFKGHWPPLMIFYNWGGTTDIDVFRVLDEEHILLGNDELRIYKLAVFRPNPYWQYFIYLESEPDPTTGLYDERARETEEYAIYQGELVSRAEYDDGCIFRNGKSISIPGAELRVRHVKPTNLIVASRNSPINSNAFDRERSLLLEGILKGNKSLADFIRTFERLPKHPNDS